MLSVGASRERRGKGGRGWRRAGIRRFSSVIGVTTQIWQMLFATRTMERRRTVVVSKVNERVRPIEAKKRMKKRQRKTTTKKKKKRTMLLNLSRATRGSSTARYLTGMPHKHLLSSFRTLHYRMAQPAAESSNALSRISFPGPLCVLCKTPTPSALDIFIPERTKARKKKPQVSGSLLPSLFPYVMGRASLRRWSFYRRVWLTFFAVPCLDISLPLNVFSEYSDV